MDIGNGSSSSVNIAGHECEIYEPAELNTHGYWLVYLHDVDLSPFTRLRAYVEQSDRFGLPVLSPSSKRSWWVDRLCPEFDKELSGEKFVVQAVLQYLADVRGCQPPQIGLFGVGMGGQGALRLAYRYPDLFPVVAGVAPVIDFHMEIDYGNDGMLPLMYGDPEEARQDTATLHIHPLNWPRHQYFCCDPGDKICWESVDRLVMKLHSLGVPFERELSTEAGGHSPTYFGTMAKPVMEFLADRLDRERLRLPVK